MARRGRQVWTDVVSSPRWGWHRPPLRPPRPSSRTGRTPNHRLRSRTTGAGRGGQALPRRLDHGQQSPDPRRALGLSGADRFAGQPSGPRPERPAPGQCVRESAWGALPRRRHARTAADPADRPRGAPEPQRSVRHRQPGQPARHLVRDQRSGTGLRPAGRRRPARPPPTPGRRTQRSCERRAAHWPKAAYTPRTIAGRSARRSPTCTTCGRADCCWRGSTTGWARASIKTAKASTASAVPTTPPRSPTARCSSWRGTRTSHGCWTTCAATSNSPSTGSSPTARWRRCSPGGRIRPASRMCGST